MAQVSALFAKQAADCRELGSAFTARVLEQVLPVLHGGNALGRAVMARDWLPEDALALRLAGALHGLARAGDAGLSAVYPPHEVSDAVLAQALAGVVERRAVDLVPWLAGPPQTNEVARSAVLIATAHWLTARYGLPLVLSELGASAGLNLLWDHFGLSLPGLHLGPEDAAVTLEPDWRGVWPVVAEPVILARAGVDLSPLDPETDRDRLLAYVWADQAARLARCRAALDLAAQLRPVVVRGDAGAWAEGRLAEEEDGRLHLMFHSVAAKYFPPATTARLERAFQLAGARATSARPLAHLSMEYDGPTPGAALVLRLWPGDLVIALGRADFHGRWVDWRAP